jgi:hypothetical protein
MMVVGIKSKKECIKALRICSLGDKKQDNGVSCEDCPYKSYSYKGKNYQGTNCDEEMMKDALEYLLCRQI